MNNIVGCTLIVKDDFNNILISQKKVKKNQPKLWYLFERNLKAKETAEKCINRIVKEDLKTIVFDLEHIKEYVKDESTGEILQLYTGVIRENPTLGTNIATCKWINEKSLDLYDFAPGEKEKIVAFFNK